MNYSETMDYIKSADKFGSSLGLDRTEKILEYLGNPHKKIRCIHVAGTNGKGSTTAMIAKILETSGYKVGMYTSPFLMEFEERIQINGLNISKGDLAYVVTKVSEAVGYVLTLGLGNPTEFEIITCGAFLYFYIKKVDLAVIEVGLGGRLDSTNVIMPILSVITSISYDHMNILGDTLEKISYEKAGIIKEGIPVVTFPQKEEARNVIKKVCIEKKCNLIEVNRESIFLDRIILNSCQKFTVDTGSETYNISLSLLGKHQAINCAVAVFAAEQLISQGIKIKKECMVNALSMVKWPGRLEIMSRNPLVILDGAHNTDGISVLSESIKEYFSYHNIILILGILADKQVEKMVSILTPVAKRVITVTPHSKRAKENLELKKVVEKYNADCEYIDDYEKAYKSGLSLCMEDDMLLICGSLYMIGDMRKIITSV